MRLRTLLVVIPCLSASLSFGSDKSRVVYVQDQYSGMREWHLRVGTHHCPGVRSTDEWGAHLDFSAYEEPNRTLLYVLATELDQKHTFKTHGRATLETLVDGQPAQFAQASDIFVKHHGSHSHKSVTETIPFALTLNDIVVMSQGQALQFRISTKDGYVERCAYTKDMRDLTDFLASAKIN